MIKENENDIAAFDYDALGRRIRKIDYADSNNSRLYYHNYNWQVVCDYNAGDVYQRNYVYGNYIDEVQVALNSSIASNIATTFSGGTSGNIL